jgi:hypothetical protein
MEEIKTGVFQINNNNSIYVIGDIHGDYQCLIHCLVDLCEVANIVSVDQDNKFNESNRECLEWIPGNNSIVIFCGDLIHRKRFEDTVLDDECSDIFIIKTLFRLKKIAQKNNGDVVIISGNHEIMNIIDPTDNTYTSEKNVQVNFKYFNNKSFVNEYISKTYAWIKINDILIAHGGLCSDYLKFLDNENIFDKKLFGGNGKASKVSNSRIMIGGNIITLGDEVVDFINRKYRDFFTNFDKDTSKKDNIGFKLFVEYDFNNKHSHNIFWCREWGYSGINCENFNDIIKKVDCTKMIVAHCPQFLANNKPKMINFECVDESNSNNSTQKFKIARVDLGMSRSFEYNKSDDFFKFLQYNYNRKISVLKLSFDSNSKEYFFNYTSVITKRLSCIQYLLIKYGITKNDWDKKNISSNWLGFEYIKLLLDSINENNNQEKKNNQHDHINEENNKNILKSNGIDKCSTQTEPNKVLLCLLYPVLAYKQNLKSVNQFLELHK